MAVVHTESEKESSCKYEKKTAIRLKIKCRIEKFEALMNSTERGAGRLVSEGVSSKLMPEAIWMLEVFLSGDVSGVAPHWSHWPHTSVNLHLTGETYEEEFETLDATFHLYFLDGADKIVSIDKGSGEFGGEEYPEYHCGGTACRYRVEKALHADGSLLVAADVDSSFPTALLFTWIYCNGRPSSPSSTAMRLPPTATSRSAHRRDRGVLALIKARLLFQIGGETIPAHKLFLMACSPVFEAMFTNSASEESKSGVVKITDFQRAEPMRAVVRYCYQGQLDTETKDGDGAVEIFQLADKYLIDDLKAQLEERFIRKTLSVGSVIEMAKLADAHSAAKLKKACVELIARKWDAVAESAEWKRLVEEMPELAAELAEAATAWK